jgi:TolA-binding protein
MSTKKLDKEHVESIQTLRSKFAQNASTLGSLAIEEHVLNSQLKQIETFKEEQLQLFETLRGEESELMASLKERYGEGEINIQDGTFTPAE